MRQVLFSRSGSKSRGCGITKGRRGGTVVRRLDGGLLRGEKSGCRGWGSLLLFGWFSCVLLAEVWGAGVGCSWHRLRLSEPGTWPYSKFLRENEVPKYNRFQKESNTCTWSKPIYREVYYTSFNRRRLPTRRSTSKGVISKSMSKA